MTRKMNVTGFQDATGANIIKGKIGQSKDVAVDLLKVDKHSDNPNGMTMRGNFTASSLGVTGSRVISFPSSRGIPKRTAALRTG